MGITISRGSVGQGTPANIAVELTVASVDSWVITAVTVSTAGLFTAISDITAVAQTSKTGSGVGTPTFDLTLSIASIAVSTPGSGYTTAPTVTLGGAGLAGQSATAALSADSALDTVTVANSPATGATVFPTATLSGGGGTGAAIAVTAEVFSASVVDGGDSGYAINDVITIAHAGVGTATAANTDIELTVASVDSGVITAVTVSTAGAFTAISDITAVQQTSKTGSGVGTPTFDLTLSIASIAVSTPGSGYTTAPTVTLGGAGLVGQSATATLDSGAINAITVSSLTTGVITSVTVLTAGAFTAISDITAVAQTSKNGHGVGTPTFDLTLSIASIAVSTAGTGYTSAP